MNEHDNSVPAEAELANLRACAADTQAWIDSSLGWQRKCEAAVEYAATLRRGYNNIRELVAFALRNPKNITAELLGQIDAQSLMALNTGMTAMAPRGYEARIQWLRSNFCPRHAEMCEMSSGPCGLCAEHDLREENEKLRKDIAHVLDCRDERCTRCSDLQLAALKAGNSDDAAEAAAERSATGLRRALEEVLARLPDEKTIEALKADKGYGYRPYPMEPMPRDSDIVRWRAALNAWEKSH